jgi:tetratricopeptide (TPR) repeat protein
MSRWLEDAGERLTFYHAAVWVFVACTVFGIMVAYYLLAKDRIGIVGAVGVLLVAWVLSAVVTFGVWTMSGVVSRGLVQTMTGAGNLPPAPGFSLQESLVARGKYQEAAEAYLAHLERTPDDPYARLALAGLLREHLGDPAKAERVYLEARARRPPPNIEFSIANSLIDLYHRTGQHGRELAELARFAERFRGTPEGARAREAIARIKAGDE